MRTLQITRSASVTLDGSGNGIISLGPASAGEIWLPESVRISSTGTPAAGTGTSCAIYAGPSPTPQYFVDRAYNTSGSASSLISGQQIHPGSLIWAVFANAGAGATGTLVVSGTRTVP